MKILLVNPEVPNTFWSFKEALRFVAKKAVLPPLGLLTVASILPETFEKKLVDLNIEPLNDSDILWADYVFITGMVIQKNSADEIIERVKRLNGKIVAGGPLFTAFPEAYLHLDHLVLREAEITLPLFLKDLSEGCLRPYYNTHDYPDLETSPIPDWSLVDMKKYSTMGIQYSRGCPFNCDFCDITNLFGHKVRTKPTDRIIAELERIYANNWRGEVFFVDDNFIGKRKQLKNELLPAIIDWMKERNYPFKFNTQASIDLVDDEELMRLMVLAGFNCVFVGIESPSELSLSECGKIQNEGRDIVASVKRIQSFGMQVQAGFIVGFDSDKPDIFDRMISLIQDSGVVTAMVGLLNAPRGTALYKKMIKENRLTTPPTGDNMDFTMNFKPKMNVDELVSGYRKVLETIYCPKNYTQRIKTFLANYNLSNQIGRNVHLSDIRPLFMSIWKIGMRGRGKRHYWNLLFWTMRRPRMFPLAVRLSIYGFHYRQMLKGLNLQA